MTIFGLIVLVPVLISGSVLALTTVLPGRTALNPGVSFSDHAGEVVVRESTIHFKDCNGKSQVSAVGIIGNTGLVGWKNLHLEVRHFDANGNLIDAASSKEYAMVLPAGGEAAFRVSGTATRPEKDYARHEVLVKHAEDLEAWP